MKGFALLELPKDITDQKAILKRKFFDIVYVIGFFSTTPVARQTVSNSATVATLITALKKYGLIG